MTNEEFEAADAELLAHANSVLLNRKDMYAQDYDRLANFKETAAQTGLSPEKVCEVYMYKALSAMFKILNGAPAIGETLNDRFSDPLNYVRLAYAMVREKQAKQVAKPLADTFLAGLYNTNTLDGSADLNNTLTSDQRARAGNRFVD